MLVSVEEKFEKVIEEFYFSWGHESQKQTNMIVMVVR